MPDIKARTHVQLDYRTIKEAVAFWFMNQYDIQVTINDVLITDDNNKGIYGSISYDTIVEHKGGV